MWEEEFYIFDSEIISENDFDERVEYEGYTSFADSMLGEEVVNKLNQLYGENEQLKTRNNNQAKQLDNLYQLIEQKDWRALSDILDDFKRCDEQLQKEWGTYGDVE